MHYIYIHRYTINFNKVREAHLSPPDCFDLLIRYSLSFKYGVIKVCFFVCVCACNTCYNTELGGRLHCNSSKTFQGGNFISAVTQWCVMYTRLVGLLRTVFFFFSA